jgi:C_GCAxxG_C_C family probable redox protein
LLPEQTCQSLVKAATAFSGGIGLTKQDLCGALSGGVIVIGALYGRTNAQESDEKSSKLAAAFRERFEQHFAMVNCHDLRKEKYGRDNPVPCSQLVEEAATLLCQTLLSTGDFLE